MKLKFPVLIAIAFFLTAKTSFSQGVTSQIDSIFEDWNQTDEPGGAVGILKNGEVIYSKGFGLADLEHSIPITPKSVFYLASVSKQFTAFSILLLEEKGLISLEDEIQKYLPDFPRYEAPIKISHLIHHTSGLRDYSTLIDLQGRSYLEDISEWEVYNLIKNQKSLNFPPGDRYLYSNTGYFLLSKVIEVITHQSLKEFARLNIFEPLGMVNTTFLDDNRMLIKNRAFSYEPNTEKDGFYNIIRRFDLVGSGGIYSSIEDLSLWDKNFDQNTLGKGGQAIIEKMYQVEPLSDGKRNGYAFGLENKTYRGLNRVSHSGSNAGFRTFYIRFPEHQLSIILLSNRRDGDLNKVFDLVDLLLEDHLASEPSNPKSIAEPKDGSKLAEVSSKDLDKIIGRYYSQELNTFYSISKQDQRFMLSINHGEFTPLEIVDEMTLFSESFGTLSFERKRNKIKGFHLSIDRILGIYFDRIKD